MKSITSVASGTSKSRQDAVLGQDRRIMDDPLSAFDDNLRTQWSIGVEYGVIIATHDPPSADQ